MPLESIVFLILGSMAGGFINGLSGTGTALFALGFYLAVLDPLRAVAIVALMAVLSGLQGLWEVRASIRGAKARLLRFLLPGLLGVPLGMSLLSAINGEMLRIGIGVLLLVYGGYFSFRTALPAFARVTPLLDNLVGLIGGVLGGAASVAGAIPSMWLSLRPWPKSEIRAVLQPFNVMILSTTIVLLMFRGAYDGMTFRALLVTLPSGLLAAQLGLFVFRRISDRVFRRLLIGLTFMMGIGLLGQAVL